MIDRTALRREALTWLGTPWRHCAALKGVGVDCAQLIFRTLQAVGLIDQDLILTDYSKQFHLHRRQEVFLGYLLRLADELPETEKRRSDLVLYRFGKVYNHGGLVVGWPVIIHAAYPAGVILDDADRVTTAPERPVGKKYFRLRDNPTVQLDQQELFIKRNQQGRKS